MTLIELELGAVAHLNINNPPMNLISDDLLAELDAALATLEGAAPGEVRAVVVSDDPEQAFALRRAWEAQLAEIPLDIVESPYLALAQPTVAYLDSLDDDVDDEVVPITFVILPQYVARHWWERPLYNQSTKPLRAALIGRPHTVVVDVPYTPRRPGAPRVVPTTA